MKCKTCNGLGRTKATEFIGVDEGLRDIVILCPTCGGKGEVHMTNADWFDSLTTEEKAVFMTLYTLRRINVHEKTFYETAAQSANEAMELTVGTKKIKAYKELLAWLKGEHKA